MKELQKKDTNQLICFKNLEITITQIPSRIKRQDGIANCLQ